MSTIQNLKNFIRHGKQARAADPPRDQPTTNVSQIHAQPQKAHGYGNSEPGAVRQQQQYQAYDGYSVGVGDNRNVAAQAGAAAAQVTGKNQKINKVNEADIHAIVAEEREKQGKLPRYPGLERYHLMEKMGDGAFSNVYRARDSQSNSEVAIKVVRKFEMNSNQGDAHLHPDFKKQPKVVERANILKEVQIMRQLDHPNIVKLIDFSESRQYYYIVLELCPGGELFHQIVRLTYFSEDLSRHVIVQVANAMLYLHEERGVVHRDIKPENLLFYPVPFIPTRNPKPRAPEDEEKADEGEFIPGYGSGGIGQIKIADFGLSKVVWDSQTMTPCGTVGYTAPEIVKDERYSKSVDMWALGCVLYTLLCGFPPFYDESIQVLTEKVARGQYTFLSPWWDDISKPAQDLVSHLLTVNPDKRYTIEQFLEHPWIRGTEEDTHAADDAPPLATPLVVRQNMWASGNKPGDVPNEQYTLETPGTAGARRMDFRSPGAINLREVFDVGYAVHRQEEEAKRRKNFKQGYRGSGVPGMSGLHPLNEDDDDYDDDDEEFEEDIASKVPKSQAPTDVASMEAKLRSTNLGPQPSAAAQARAAAATPARSQHHGQQQRDEKGYGQHSAAVAAAAKQSVARKNRQPFELSLDNSTLLGRRNKGPGGIGGMQLQMPGQPDKPSKLREEHGLLYLVAIVATLANSDGGVRGGGISPNSPTSPDRRVFAAGLGHKRNASIAGLDSSPGSIESPEVDHDGTEDGNARRTSRREPVKRACNECRQQKLRCDVVQEPFTQCSRCRRLHLDCRIENNFKRVGKRSRNAAMEEEIIELRKQVAQQKRALQNGNNSHTVGFDQWNGSHEAVAGLLDLKSGLDGMKNSVFKRLEDVTLTHDRVVELFKRFFVYFHPFCPFLNPDRSPDEYFQRSPLLFWTIISVGARHYSNEQGLFNALSAPVMRLVWSTIAEVPQNYHVVKALILLCAWPFPTSSTSTDPTFMLCGIMMQIALQIGLHRPDHAQDFTKFRIELRETEVQDRIRTWAVCNIVAQRVATSYGQPSLTIYDWTLATDSNPSYDLPKLVFNRLLIEKFVDKVSKALYTNDRDSVGLSSDQDRTAYVSFLTKDFEELETRLRDDASAVTKLYLRAAYLHLRLNVFFSPSNHPNYRNELLKVYYATTAFLDTCLSLESSTDVAMPSNNYHTGLSLQYAPMYVFQMMLAAGFSLLKLMHNFMQQHELDSQGASEMLTRTVWAIRSMSVTENDLAERLAEVLAQVWKSGRVRAETNETTGDGEFDDGLLLKVRCRMSMSLVFDSVWRWRKNFQFKNGKTLEAHLHLQNPTYPSAPPDPNAPSNALTQQPSIDPSAATALSLDTTQSISLPGLAIDNTYANMDYAAADSTSYEVFDPLNWMLDGVMDFPSYGISTIQTLEQQAGLGNGGLGVNVNGGDME